MEQPVIERRVRRAEHPSEAARLFLSAIAAESECEAIALATDHGLLVAGVDLEWLAALASLSDHAARLAPAVAGERVEAFSVRIGPHALHVASAGAPIDVARCEAGLRRICAPLFASAARRSSTAC